MLLLLRPQSTIYFVRAPPLSPHSTASSPYVEWTFGDIAELLPKKVRNLTPKPVHNELWVS